MTSQHHAHPHAHPQVKHRSLPWRRRLLRTGRRLAVLSGLSVAATGLVVGGGVLVSSMPAAPSSAETTSLASSHVAREVTEAQITQDAARDRDQRVSRSADRVPVAGPSKARNLSNASGPARTRTVDLSSADPRTLAKALMPQFGMPVSQFSCLDSVWSQESGWNVHAANPSSSAYGIPQALPGSKMSSAGPDWENNPVTQIKWGLGYIKGRYGSACGAAGFKSSHGWY